MSELYSLKNIEQYYEEKKVLDIKELTLEENQIIGFFGPNGSGKSTLFNLLSFINKANKGRIYFNNIDSKNLDLKTKQSIVMLPQNPYLLKRSIFDNISYGLKIRNDFNNINNRVLEALSYVGLDKSFLSRKWNQLSGGEAQRVALASRLILKPKVLILDEPTSGVDTSSAQLIKEAIFLAKQQWDTTLLISSHDHNWLNHVCDKKIALFQGKLIENGNINLLFAPWSKNENGDLVKEFLDGQKLILPNTLQRKRDSIVIINSEDISFCEEKTKDSLIVTVNSIMQENIEDEVLVEMVLSGITLNKKVLKKYIQEKQIFPGNEMYIKINSKNLYWL